MHAAKRILSVGPLIITNPALRGENYFGPANDAVDEMRVDRKNIIEPNENTIVLIIRQGRNFLLSNPYLILLLDYRLKNSTHIIESFDRGYDER